MKEYKHTYYYGNTEKEVTETREEYWKQEKLFYMEEHGIYEIYSETLKTITYFSYFGGEGFYKVHKNIETGKETRKHISRKPTNYNYFCG